MKFIIKRASDMSLNAKQPTEKAYLDEEINLWCIDINSVEELTELCEDVGNIIVSTPCGGDLYEIIIYDAYLE